MSLIFNPETRQFEDSESSTKPPPPPYISNIIKDVVPYLNPIYTKQQPYDALAPMRMYQQYQQTGQINSIPGMYQPFNGPQTPQGNTPISTAPIASSPSPGGGGK